MVDPFSTAVAVASLVAAATKLLQSFNNYRAKYNCSDLSSISIKAQCDCILIALGQIQAALLSKRQLAARLMSGDSISGQRLDSVLGACELTFGVIVSRLSKLNKSLDKDAGKLSAREKINRLWKQSEISELSQNISRLSEGLNLLLTAFNTKSQCEIQEILTSQRASIILEQVTDDASSIYLSDRRASYIDNACSVDEEAVIHAEVDPKDFSFDQEVLMTPAYRKVQISPGMQHEKATIAKLLDSTSSEKPADSITADQIVAGASTAKLADSSKQLVKLASVQHSMPNAQPHQHRLALIPRKPLPPLPSTALLKNEQFAEIPGQPVDPSKDTEPHDFTRGCGLATTSTVVPSSSTDSTPKPMDPAPDLGVSLKSLRDSAECRANEAEVHALIPVTATSLVQTMNSAAKVTLKDFMPQSSDVTTPTKPDPLTLLVTPRVINIIGRNIQFIPSHAVRAVQSSLQSLCLSQNCISTLPKSLEGCQNLTYLNLCSNGLRSVPSEICRLRSLKILHLAANQIEVLPDELANLKTLEFLNVAINRLTNLPLFLTKLESLKVVYAHNNPFLSLFLHVWQTKYSTYMGGDERQQHATTKLKAYLTEHQLPHNFELLFHEPLSMDIMRSEGDRAVKKYIGVAF